jgi:ferric-dicitrate binding protein FerR (iron transport regulator)
MAAAKAAEWLSRLQNDTCQAIDRQAFVVWFGESSIHREQFFAAGIGRQELDILKLVASLNIKATDCVIHRPPNCRSDGREIVP